MKLSNPKIDGNGFSLQTLIDRMNKTFRREVTVSGNIEKPTGDGPADHFQGIAPINGVRAFTGNISASANAWWCASFEETSAVTAKVVGMLAWGNYYNHPGGIQRLGDLLPIGLENDNGEATVAFYDVTTPQPPYKPLFELHNVPYKASAVAITNYTDAKWGEQALLFVYRYDPHFFYVFRAPVEKADQEHAWIPMGETNALLAEEQFQCFALVTQANSGGDVVYLIGFRSDETLVMWTVNTTEPNYGDLLIVRTWPNWEGSNWRGAAGLQIVNPQEIRIFGSYKWSGGDMEYTFPLFIWT